MGHGSQSRSPRPTLTPSCSNHRRLPPLTPPLNSLVVKPSPREGNDASASLDATAAAACSSPTPTTGASGRHRTSSLPCRRCDLSPANSLGKERHCSPLPPLLARRRPPGSPPPQRRRLSPPPTRRLTPPDFQPRHPRPYHELQGLFKTLDSPFIF